MKAYKYVAKEKNGQTVSAILEATSEAEVAEILHKKGLIVLTMQEVKSGLAKRKSSRVKLEDLVIFSRQLATLIDAGVPVAQSLDILTQQVEDKDFRNVIINIRQDIEGGLSFSDALARHPQIFSDLFINMTRAGEASGTLNEVLDRLATYLENSAALSAKIRSSLAYPAVVISMAIIITAILLLKVVPTFKGIFEVLGGRLPLPTLILIGISDIFRKYFLILMIIFVAGFILFKKYIATEKGRYNFDNFKLKVPILGTLFLKVALAKFSRTFSTLVKSGVSILNVLDIVGSTAGNKVIEKTIIDCRSSVRQGEPISEPLSKSKVFPAMVWRMIGVGEKTGQLEKMLGKIADFYDEQVNTAVAGLVSMIEPLVIAFLGIVIGGIVISLFLPVFKITELISK